VSNHTCWSCQGEFISMANYAAHLKSCGVQAKPQEPFIPDGPPELLGGNLWTPEIKRLHVMTHVAAKFGSQASFEAAERALIAKAPWTGQACAYELPSDVARLCRLCLYPRPNANWLAYTFQPPEYGTEVEFEIDTTKRCTVCDREWCEALDSYAGKDWRLGDMCATCRRKA
jgi:hypothetical protein